MVKSMTGYGRAVETINGREFTVELRSVNNRYLDCTVKLPRSLSFAEDKLKQAVKATITRGKVDLFVSVRSEGGEEVRVSLNRPMVEGYLAAMKELTGTYGISDDISVGLLARMPEVFTVERAQVDEEQLLLDLMQVAAKALESYDAMRTAEGAALEQDLRSHLAQMDAMLESGGPIGRKLDFLLQEMNREANTIGSKCTDVRLARIVVDIKAELEKIREQTQNIE